MAVGLYLAGVVTGVVLTIAVARWVEKQHPGPYEW